MNEVELSEFQSILDKIMSNPKSSDVEKRQAITSLWLACELDIKSTAEYEDYKKEQREIEARALSASSASDFASFFRSPEGGVFLRSPAGMKWSALGGAIITWEDNLNDRE